MMEKIEKYRDDTQFLMLSGVVIALVIVLFYLLQTMAQNRPTVQSADRLKAEIQAMESDIAAMSGMASLESVDSYWISLFDTAEKTGLELKVARVPEEQRYQGPLQSRTGVLEGPTDVMLATLHKLQEQIPLFLYSIKIEGHMAEITLSVVGV